jgi:D-3-phosphoglycerate dehydrogenase
LSKWKVLITDEIKDNGKKILNLTAEVDDRNGILEDELKEIVHQYNAIIVRGRTKVTADLLDTARNLAVIGRAGVGVDNIDLAAAQYKKITVVNSPNATTIAVAEHTLGLMLSLVRKIPKADSSMKSGQWQKNRFLGTELYNKTLGIIGVGRIGSMVAKKASAFNMHVLGYDPNVESNIMLQQGIESVDLSELLSRSDIITLHVPYCSDTKNLIDGQVMGLMKRGVRIICTARGGIIDETALLAGLESGQIAGAALDVYQDEPPGLTALVAHPNVIATPHIGAQTHEAQIRASEDIATEVIRALNNEPLRWKIV